MAYSSILASVREEHISAFCQDGVAPLLASRVITISHLIAYWVREQPLGQMLGEAIDGGEALHSAVPHPPLRRPVFHAAAVVPDLSRRLQEAHRQAVEAPEDEWYEAQILQVMGLFAWANEQGEAVVSLLGSPSCQDRISLLTNPSGEKE